MEEEISVQYNQHPFVDYVARLRGPKIDMVRGMFASNFYMQKIGAR